MAPDRWWGYSAANTHFFLFNYSCFRSHQGHWMVTAYLKNRRRKGRDRALITWSCLPAYTDLSSWTQLSPWTSFFCWATLGSVLATDQYITILKGKHWIWEVIIWIQRWCGDEQTYSCGRNTVDEAWVKDKANIREGYTEKQYLWQGGISLRSLFGRNKVHFNKSSRWFWPH